MTYRLIAFVYNTIRILSSTTAAATVGIIVFAFISTDDSNPVVIVTYSVAIISVQLSLKINDKIFFPGYDAANDLTITTTTTTLLTITTTNYDFISSTIF